MGVTHLQNLGSLGVWGLDLLLYFPIIKKLNIYATEFFKIVYVNIIITIFKVLNLRLINEIGTIKLYSGQYRE